MAEDQRETLRKIMSTERHDYWAELKLTAWLQRAATANKAEDLFA